MGNENSLGGNKINKIIDPDKLKDNLDYNSKPRDYLMPKLIKEQANSEVSLESSPVATPEPSTKPEPTSSESVPSESSSSQVEIPSSTSLEPSQSQTRASQATVLINQA